MNIRLNKEEDNEKVKVGNNNKIDTNRKELIHNIVNKVIDRNESAFKKLSKS